MVSRRLTRIIAITLTAVVIGGGVYGIVSATAKNNSGTSTTATSPPATLGGFAPGSGGSNASSGPSAGGAVGTIVSVSTSNFTLSTAAGQNVTVDKTSSTQYTTAAGSTSAGAVKRGEAVLVVGTTSGTTIIATQVIVQPAGGGSATSSAAAVVPFQRGAPSTSKQVGQIPADYTQGSGTIVSGATANKATEAALTAYPGGIIDRVVELSNGEYEVHNIGVNWPHHIFVDKSFKVVGAD